MSLPTIEQRLLKLLLLTAEEKRPCRACGVDLYFVRHRTGTKAPYTADGLNHFVNCPQAARFKRGTIRVAPAKA